MYCYTFTLLYCMLSDRAIKAHYVDMDENKDNIMSRITIKNEQDMKERRAVKEEDIIRSFPMKYEKMGYHINEEHDDIVVESSNIVVADDHKDFHSMMVDKTLVGKLDGLKKQKSVVLVKSVPYIHTGKNIKESLPAQKGMGDKAKDVCCGKPKCGKESLSDTPRIKCSVCYKCFPHVDHLREHIKEHLDKSVPNIHTGKNVKESSNAQNGLLRLLNENRHKVTGDKAKDSKESLGDTVRIKCSVCYKCFPHVDHLREHLTVHTRQIPHTCKVCGKSFSTKDC